MQSVKPFRAMKSVPVCCWLVQPLSQEAQVTPYHGPAFRTRSQRAAAEVVVCAGGAASGRLSFIIPTVAAGEREPHPGQAPGPGAALEQDFRGRRTRRQVLHLTGVTVVPHLSRLIKQQCWRKRVVTQKEHWKLVCHMMCCTDRLIHFIIDLIAPDKQRLFLNCIILHIRGSGP